MRDNLLCKDDEFVEYGRQTGSSCLDNWNFFLFGLVLLACLLEVVVLHTSYGGCCLGNASSCFLSCIPLTFCSSFSPSASDLHRTTFIADERFQSFYVENSGIWTLQIKYVQARDAGVYECQVSTEPKISARVQLLVVGKCWCQGWVVFYIISHGDWHGASPM